MAFEREVFPVLENASGQGSALSQAQAGDAATGKRGLVSFGFRDSSGNLILPQLTPDGKLPVSSESAGTCLKAFGKSATGSLTEISLASITLAVSTSYSGIACNVSSTRLAAFRVVHNNDGSDVELGVLIVGPGQYSADLYQPCLEFTSGATGTQELKVMALNIEKASQLSATISCLQKA